MHQEVIVIQAGQRGRNYWRDLWRYRELLYFLARRDISVRYKQAALGIAWAIIRPVVAMLVFTVVFGRIAKLPSEGMPYSVLVFAGMLPWFFFAAAVSESSNSLVANANLLTKVYFPRLLVPLSSIGVAFVDLVIGLVILFAYLIIVDHPIAPTAFIGAAFLLLALATAMGLGLWFAALNVKYRDFQFIVPFILQIGLYVSPIGFSARVVPEKWRLAYALNPMAPAIEGFRWAIAGGTISFGGDALILSIAIAIIVLLTGLWFFRRTERALADVI